VPISGTAMGLGKTSAVAEATLTSNKTLDMAVRRITRHLAFRVGP
jgi:hypothetical protein